MQNPHTCSIYQCYHQPVCTASKGTLGQIFVTSSDVAVTPGINAPVIDKAIKLCLDWGNVRSLTISHVIAGKPAVRCHYNLNSTSDIDSHWLRLWGTCAYPMLSLPLRIPLGRTLGSLHLILDFPVSAGWGKDKMHMHWEIHVTQTHVGNKTTTIKTNKQTSKRIKTKPQNLIGQKQKHLWALITAQCSRYGNGVP